MKKRHTFPFILIPFFLYLPAGAHLSAQTTGDSLVLTFAGDLMAHAPSFRMSDFSDIYAGLGELLHRDDLSFVNLETVVDPFKPYQTFPFFNVRIPYVEEAVLAGFDVFSLANNHTNDHGSWSALQTLLSVQRLQRTYPGRVHSSGIRRHEQEAMGITEIRHRDWTIGFLSVTAFINEWKGHERTYMVPYWDAEAERALLSLIREHRPRFDLFILSYHGGTEYVTQPQERKMAFMRQLYEAGADIVWGHHPHVLQPWEVQYAPPPADVTPGYPEADDPYLPRIRGVIMPSLGNFVSGQTWFLGPGDWAVNRAFTGDSVLLRVRVHRRYRPGQYSPEITMDMPQAILISTKNVRTGPTAEQGTFVNLIRDLTQDINLREEWRTFYRNRLEQVQSLLRHALKRDRTPW